VIDHKVHIERLFLDVQTRRDAPAVSPFVATCIRRGRLARVVGRAAAISNTTGPVSGPLLYGEQPSRAAATCHCRGDEYRDWKHERSHGETPSREQRREVSKPLCVDATALSNYSERYAPEGQESFQFAMESFGICIHNAGLRLGSTTQNG